MKIIRIISQSVLLVVVILTFSACQGEEHNQAIEQAQTTSVKPKLTMGEWGGGALHDGSGRIGSYLYKGEDKKAEFEKHNTLPYGLFVPEFMEQRILQDGVEWGYGEPRNSFALFDGKLVEPDADYYDSEQSNYEEYQGSRHDQEGRIIDYYSIHDQEHELMIKLSYTEKEKEAIHPIFLAMLNSIKIVHSHDQFEQGVYVSYDEKALSELEAAILPVINNNLKAIISKDAKSFASRMESPELAEALQYIIRDGILYRFDKLEFIEAIDEKRINVGIHYQLLSEEGFLSDAIKTYTMRQDKSGTWMIASID